MSQASMIFMKLSTENDIFFLQWCIEISFVDVPYNYDSL